MNKKLFLTVLVAAMLALCLAGCGNSGGGAAEKPAAASSVATVTSEASAEKVVKDDGMPNLELLFQAYQAGGADEVEALLSAELPKSKNSAPDISYYCSNDEVAASFHSASVGFSLSEGEWVIEPSDYVINMYVPATETDEDAVDAIARYTGAQKVWVFEGNSCGYFQCNGYYGYALFARNQEIRLMMNADEPNIDRVKQYVENHDGPVKEYTL